MDDCEFARAIEPGAYPPDGVPFLPVESLAAVYGKMIGFGSPPAMHCLHLAAWSVLTGVCTKQQMAETIKQAFDASADPVARVVELRRLLAAYFLRAGNLQVITVKLPCQLPTASTSTPLTAAVLNLARRICEGLDGCGETLFQAATVAATAVESERLDMSELWGLVAEARRLAPETPRLAFHSLMHWIERLYLLRERRTSPAAPAPNTAQDVDQLYKWLEPSAN